jgi:hypothetical protein
MPDFEAVSVQQAKLITAPGHQGRFIKEYAGDLQQLPRARLGNSMLSDGGVF